jgi:nucleosome binding factor SPN SPT16 subunit
VVAHFARQSVWGAFKKDTAQGPFADAWMAAAEAARIGADSSVDVSKGLTFAMAVKDAAELVRRYLLLPPVASSVC